MSDEMKFKLSNARYAQRNPYAYIEQLDEMFAHGSMAHEVNATNKQIRASRNLLQNPHAYSDGEGGYSAVTHRTRKVSTSKPKSNRFTFEQIESIANDLLKNMWMDRDQLWGEMDLSDPVNAIDPVMALKVVGYDFCPEEDLGEYLAGKRLVKVAGDIDASSKLVRVSNRFPQDVRSFTAAHELGHAVLQHDVGASLHRDRAIDGQKLHRDRVELEADKFAAYFLMPTKLLKQRFFEQFGMDSFSLNEDTAFALNLGSLHDARERCGSLRGVSLMLAKADHYNGRFFPSLADQFRVSPLAMAIRLEELGLIEKQ
jgi:hypothetical protein